MNKFAICLFEGFKISDTFVETSANDFLDDSFLHIIPSGTFLLFWVLLSEKCEQFYNLPFEGSMNFCNDQHEDRGQSPQNGNVEKNRWVLEILVLCH